VAFNRGDFFEAHERWEDVWRLLPGPDRGFVQGLIQIAAGLHHLQNARPSPAASLLRKGSNRLSRGPAPPTIDLPIASLLRQIDNLIAELKGPAGAPPPDPQAIKL
jgi:predicted metal-dependent hydrolase